MKILTKYAFIGITFISSAASVLHYEAHGILWIENYITSQLSTFKINAARQIIDVIAPIQPTNTNPKTLSQIIDSEANLAILDPKLIHAIIKIESNYNTLAERYEPKLNTSSIGLMQILRTNSKFCGLNHYSALFDPSTNIKCGILILKSAIARQKSVLGALIEFNGGPNCSKNPTCYAQASNYSAKILAELAESMHR